VVVGVKLVRLGFWLKFDSTMVVGVLLVCIILWATLAN